MKKMAMTVFVSVLLSMMCAVAISADAGPDGSTDTDTDTDSDSDTDTDTDTDSDTDTGPDSGTGLNDCEDGDTRCLNDAVQHCVAGAWSNWEHCDAQGMVCEVVAGTAQCVSSASDAGTDSDDSGCGCAAVGNSTNATGFTLLKLIFALLGIR